MALPSIGEIFTDFGNDGLRVSFREFLGYFAKQFWPGVNTQIDKLPFTRLDYPLLVFPFFLLAVIALSAFWEKPTRFRAAAAGIAAGLLFYTYFHTWAYWVTILILLAGYLVFFGRHDRKRLLRFGVLIGVAAATAVPFFIRYARFAATPGHKDFFYRLWLAEGREFGLVALGYPYLIYAALAVVVYVLYWKRDQLKAVLLLAMIAAMPLVWNVQLVTGYVPVPDHWKRVISPALYIVLFIVARDYSLRLEARWPSLRKIIPIALLLFVAMAVGKKVTNAVSLSRGLQPWVAEKHAFPQELVDSWEWINQNLGREPKIISSSTMTSQYLVVYTSARPYLPYGVLTPMSTAEIEERYFKASQLFGVSEGTLSAELGDAENVPASCGAPYCFDMASNYLKTPFNLYTCYFSRGGFNTTLYHSCDIPAEYRRRLIERYGHVRIDWSGVDADYVYYGPHERQFSQPHFEKDPKLLRIYQNPLVEIYRIKR